MKTCYNHGDNLWVVFILKPGWSRVFAFLRFLRNTVQSIALNLQCGLGLGILNTGEHSQIFWKIALW